MKEVIIDQSALLTSLKKVLQNINKVDIHRKYNDLSDLAKDIDLTLDKFYEICEKRGQKLISCMFFCKGDSPEPKFTNMFLAGFAYKDNQKSPLLYKKLLDALNQANTPHSKYQLLTEYSALL